MDWKKESQNKKLKGQKNKPWSQKIKKLFDLTNSNSNSNHTIQMCVVTNHLRVQPIGHDRRLYCKVIKVVNVKKTSSCIWEVLNLYFQSPLEEDTTKQEEFCNLDRETYLDSILENLTPQVIIVIQLSEILVIDLFRMFGYLYTRRMRFHKQG